MKIECPGLSSFRRRNVESDINIIEAKAFGSFNCAIGWFFITVSPLCGTFSSMVQHSAPSARVKDLIFHMARLKQFESRGTIVSYPLITDRDEHKLAVLMFYDAGRKAENGHLCHVERLLIDKIERK